MEYETPDENNAKEDNKAKPSIILRFTRSCIKTFACPVCHCTYTHKQKLKYHVRRAHFNLIAKITTRDKREINEVWLERVINSNDVVEIKKVSETKYLMKKSNQSGCIDIEEPAETMDLSPLYPQCHPMCCAVCKKKLYKLTHRKHMELEHKDFMM